jgi:hypothetical protein
MTLEAENPTDRLPLACTLTPRAVSQRRRWLAATMSQASAVSVAPDGLVAHFDATAALEAELRGIAAAEADCCAFLQILVTRRDGELRLTITGPPAAQPIIAEMFKGADGR